MERTDVRTPRTAPTSWPFTSAEAGTAKKCRNNSYVPSIRWTSIWARSESCAAPRSHCLEIQALPQIPAYNRPRRRPRLRNFLPHGRIRLFPFLVVLLGGGLHAARGRRFCPQPCLEHSLHIAITPVTLGAVASYIPFWYWHEPRVLIGVLGRPRPARASQRIERTGDWCRALRGRGECEKKPGTAQFRSGDH